MRTLSSALSAASVHAQQGATVEIPAPLPDTIPPPLPPAPDERPPEVPGVAVPDVIELPPAHSPPPVADPSANESQFQCCC